MDIHQVNCIRCGKVTDWFDGDADIPACNKCIGTISMTSGKLITSDSIASKVYVVPEQPAQVQASPRTVLGMTLREHYAGLAMQALMSNSFNDGITRPLAMYSKFEIAELAVMHADELIEELKK